MRSEDQRYWKMTKKLIKQEKKKINKKVITMWIPKWYWEYASRKQDELERRVKRLELIIMKEAENKIASLSDKEAGTGYKERYSTIEEIVNQSLNTR